MTSHETRRCTSCGCGTYRDHDGWRHAYTDSPADDRCANPRTYADFISF